MDTFYHHISIPLDKVQREQGFPDFIFEHVKADVRNHTLIWELYNQTDISFEWSNKMLSGIGAFFMTPIIGFTISSVNCLVSWLQTWALST